MTPLVDVMLVLLIVFIVTAPLLTNTVKVTLPKTQPTTPLVQKKAFTVSVDAAGKVFLDKQELPLANFEVALREAKASTAEFYLNLQADEAVPYGTVAKVMAIIERTGVDRLSVLTMPGQG
ncbi:MAG: biopolymer transporter ExbD [Pedobacter sp.]|nr:biopolymer transporter ExbD [Pedobacter sp.]